MSYLEIAKTVQNSYLEAGDIADLVERLSDDNAVEELRRISGDRIDHLQWLLWLIVESNDKLKTEARSLLVEMGWDK